MAGVEYIASHTITYEYIIKDNPHHGLLLLISPWSGENSHGLYFSLLYLGCPSCYELFRFEFVSHFQIFKYI
jgi:hypothetical protein